MTIKCDGCGDGANLDADSVSCSRCEICKHTHCISVDDICLLKGDVFFNFLCSRCSESGTDEIFRSRLSWLAVVLLSLYNLHRSDVPSNQGYFHWRTDICQFIADHWKVLFGPKCRKKKTWQGVVSTNLTSNIDRLFASGTGDLNLQGWWKLICMEPPAAQLRAAKSIPLNKKEASTPSPGHKGHEAQPIMLKRVARPSGSCMLNAIALKEKRDYLLVDPTEKLKVKVDRKRKARDEVKRVPLKRRSDSDIRPISDFDNFWETLKVGKKHVTVPKNGAVMEELKLKGKVSSSGVQLSLRNQTADSHLYNSASLAKHIADLKELNEINQKSKVKRTYQRPKKPKPPNTVTSLLSKARNDEISCSTETENDCNDSMDGELEIDLSPQVNNLTSQPDFNRSFDMPEDDVTQEATLNTAVRPLSPAEKLDEPLSPEEPINALVFLPQYELSHLDLGREVELGENFTSLDTQDDNFPLSDVEDGALHIEEEVTDGQIQAVHEDIPNFHPHDTELYGDESTAQAIVDRSSQPILEEIFGDIVNTDPSDEEPNSPEQDSQVAADEVLDGEHGQEREVRVHRTKEKKVNTDDKEHNQLDITKKENDSKIYTEIDNKIKLDSVKKFVDNECGGNITKERKETAICLNESPAGIGENIYVKTPKHGPIAEINKNIRDKSTDIELPETMERPTKIFEDEEIEEEIHTNANEERNSDEKGSENMSKGIFESEGEDPKNRPVNDDEYVGTSGEENLNDITENDTDVDCQDVSEKSICSKWSVDTLENHKNFTVPSNILLVSFKTDGPDFIQSAYSGRRLKPFIRREFDVIPPKLQVLREIESLPQQRGELDPVDYPIDYCYIQLEHVHPVNQLIAEASHKGVDVSEALQFPDFSCVVLYKKLVIGFGLLVPDSGRDECYLTSYFVHPDWRQAGIGSFMLYHLIQTSCGKDVTVHIPATSRTVIFFQKFGFKVEKFVRNFYSSGGSTIATEHTHALYMKLSN